jgi:hypothetical protein
MPFCKHSDQGPGVRLHGCREGFWLLCPSSTRGVRKQTTPRLSMQWTFAMYWDICRLTIRPARACLEVVGRSGFYFNTREVTTTLLAPTAESL